MLYAKRSVYALILLAIFSLDGCGNKNDAVAQAQPAPKRLANVKVMTIHTEPFTGYVNLVGTVKANKRIVVSAEEGGRIERFAVDKGAYLKAGDAIAVIEANMQQAAFNLAKAQFDLADLHFSNAKKLYDENGGVSETDYKTAQFNRDIAAAQMEMAKERLEKTRITSPAPAIVVAKMVEAGELVSRGTPIAQIMDMSRVKIVAGIPETDAAYFKKGAAAEVTFDAFPGQVFTGSLAFMSPAVDPQNRTFEVEVELANPGGVIKAEMVAKLRVVKAEHKDAIVIPQDIILETERGKAVFVFQEDGKAVFRAIQTGPTHENEVMVVDGLTAGEKLIVSGQHNLTDGESVQVVE